MENENFDELNKRKEKILNFVKKKEVWVIGLLIVALVLGIYIRSLPMQDHGGNPGLWDIATNNWTLGPDLDPWLFTRYAGEIIENGKVADMDMVRNVPLGFETHLESMLLPKMIAWTYALSNLFYSGTTVEFAAALFPVIMFALTIISFFLFVREIFVRKSKKSKIKANVISLISTFFMIVTPIFLSRTVAGIPEKESAAFFFMFLAFYLFLKAWKSEKLHTACIFALLASVSTICMNLIWGGVMFVYLVIGLASLIAFLLNKVSLKETLVYGCWLMPAILIVGLLPNRSSLLGMFTSITTGSAFVVFFFMLVHFILWKTQLAKNERLRKIKLPKNVISLIVALIFILLFALIFLGPSFIIEKIQAVHQMIFQPTTGRWNTTVAENRQPYFTEWESSFGPHIMGVALMFWAFFIGSVILFKNMLKGVRKKDSWILTGSFALVLIGMIFSRYSGSSIFNGENFISKFVYYGAVLLFFFFVSKTYMKYFKEGNKSLENIRFEYILVLILLLIAVFSARGAVRLIMVLGPIAPIFLAYLNWESVASFFKEKGETKKIILGVLAIIIVLSSIFIFWTYYGNIKAQAYNMVPSQYNQQWQKAMDWVRTETPEDSVFGHWWDYGYWVQSIGERATVLDGGNAITFWNYWMGRLVLTGDNQDDALEFLYNHDATHFLIDSTDIGKYGAFSSIGSDESYDRYSWIGVLQIDQKQTYENKESINYVYAGGIGLDEDWIIEENGESIYLAKEISGVGAAIVPFVNGDNVGIRQPQLIVFSGGVQHKVPLRYVSINGEFHDFGNGIEAGLYIFPTITSDGQGVQSNPLGSAMFLSPKLMRSMLVQKYILDDPFGNYPNFEIAHTEENLLVESLNSQGMNLPEFVYSNYCGNSNNICGPIKIWEIEYTGKEQIQEKYLDKDSSKYIDWKL
jgi:asparagine N-glycosylation enzyme membrane subunit Stt3